MAPTLLASYEVDSGGNNTNTLTTTAFTPSNGEIIVVKGTTWSTGQTLNTPTGGSQTYTQRAVADFGGFSGYAAIWTAVVAGSPGSMTVSVAPAVASWHHIVVERWGSAQLAATPASGTGWYNGTAGTPSVNITTAAAGSVVTWCSQDSQSISPTGRAYLLSGTEDGIFDGSGGANGVMYFAYASVGAAGTYAMGMSAPTGQKWNLAGAEIQAAAVTAAATPAPIVITTTRPAATTQPIILRSTLVDPPVLTTAAPLVVTGPAPRAVANRGYTWRNTLADPPVLTTPAPIIGETSGRPAPVNPAIIGRSSLVDVVVPPAATPAPIVVTPVVRPVPGTAVVGRSTLVDPPVLTTPQPLIVSTPAVPVLPPQPVLVRSSLFDAATPAPLVVTPPARAPIVTPALIARSSLIDLATPTPLVVTAPWTPPRAGQTLLFRSSLADAVPAPPLATVPLVITTPWSRPHVSRPAMIRSSLVDVPVVVLPGQISGSAVGLGGMEEAGAVSATESASSALSAGIQ